MYLFIGRIRIIIRDTSGRPLSQDFSL